MKSSSVNNKNNSKTKTSSVLSVGWFLAVRQIKGSNRWTTALIIFIMMLTYLNLVVISGILVGLIEGGNIANREQYTGELIVKTTAGEKAIKDTNNIVSTLKSFPAVDIVSTRYFEGGTIEANYRERTDFDALPDTAGTQVTGITMADEEALSGLSNYIVEGEGLKEGESGKIILGANLLHRFSADFGDFFSSLEGVYPGDEVKITIDGKTKSFIVSGIVKSKVGEVSQRAFITKEDFLRLVDRPGINANEISVKLKPGAADSGAEIKSYLQKSGFTDNGNIQTAAEAIPPFLNDIKLAFSLLGNVIGLVGIVVASITIFIVIFINAVTRRKYIGIMKGIGISEKAIEFSYIIQSIFYAMLGGLLGVFVVYVLLVPLFNAHPIDFPFSDGILVAPLSGTAFKFVLLLIVTIIAGYIPARRIVKKNTLDSILGR